METELDQYLEIPGSPKETMWQSFEENTKSENKNKLKCHKIITHDCVLIPSVKNQDWVKTLTTNSNNKAIIVLDGHGKGNVVNYLKTVPWEFILDDPDPFLRVKSMLNDSIKDQRCDGSTFASVEALNDGFRCRWQGDSEILIFHNNSLCWRSPCHSLSNPVEHNNMRNLGVLIEPGYGLKVVDDKTMTMEKTGYCVWDDKLDKCNITRIFGHSHKAHHWHGEVRKIKFNKPGIWRAVVFTDGIGDMISKDDMQWLGSKKSNCRYIAEKALQRWQQDWYYLHPSTCLCESCHVSKQTLEKTPIKIGGGQNTDDIGICILELEV